VFAEISLKLATVAQCQANTKIGDETGPPDGLEQALRTEEADLSVRNMEGLDLEGARDTVAIENSPLN